MVRRLCLLISERQRIYSQRKEGIALRVQEPEHTPHSPALTSHSRAFSLPDRPSRPVLRVLSCIACSKNVSLRKREVLCRSVHSVSSCWHNAGHSVRTNGSSPVIWLSKTCSTWRNIHEQSVLRFM